MLKADVKREVWLPLLRHFIHLQFHFLNGHLMSGILSRCSYYFSIFFPILSTSSLFIFTSPLRSRLECVVILILYIVILLRPFLEREVLFPVSYLRSTPPHRKLLCRLLLIGKLRFSTVSNPFILPNIV